MDALEYIANSEDNGYVGIIEKPDFDQKMPITFPHANRKHLARLFCELGFKVGAEMGVERGKYSQTLCHWNPGLKLYSIDAWTAYKGYRDHVSQAKLDGFLEETRERLAPFNCEIIKGFSMNVVKQFEDESLDFVYIDGNHEFQQVTNDIAEWSKKVRKGGIVSGHDYRRGKGGKIRSGWICHVKDVVQGWTYANAIRPWFVMGKKGFSPSWFWVKQ